MIDIGTACYLCIAADKLCANMYDWIKFVPLVWAFFFIIELEIGSFCPTNC